MRDYKTFIKLFDLNIPDFENFNYYIEQYSKLERFKDIQKSIEMYHDFESFTDNPFDYKINKSEEIINYLKNTRAFNELNDDNLIPELSTTKNFEYSEEKKYISVDINHANYQVLKKYDPEFLNELDDSWINLLQKFDVHPVFHKSKHFRQFIFGHLNPKKQVRAQRVIIEDFINSIDKTNLEIVCIKHDEVILSFSDWSQILQIVEEVDNISYLKWKLFTVERKEDFRINSFYDVYGNLIYKDLSGCNGNKYFIYLKKYIFEQTLDIRDLFFRMDGNLAIWKIDGLKLEL